ncbi:IclR family transcriptional regulator [Mycobacterium sp. ACS4331]|uniref:IclR family transcriptional regulator n=1 Tax=Mycobacterium sp. ACS4331 TaxID=1834121 RepID=UPI0008322EDB|nr:IclR family transcriptional regulator [Mycobacterium sp. ACS4331]
MTSRAGSSKRASPDQSVELIAKADEVLELLLSTPSLTVAQIAEGVGMPRPSVYRLLSTLEAVGFARPTAAGNRYQLGLRLFELGQIASARNPLVNQARSAMEELARITGESVFLTVRRGDEALCLARIPGARTALMVLDAGGTLPLHVGAGPRLLLASADDADIEDYIARCATTAEPPYQLQDVDHLRAQLRTARQDGYSLSEEDVVPGVATIAAPLRNRQGVTVAALSVGGARDVVSGEDPTRLARTIVEVAESIRLE